MKFTPREPNTTKAKIYSITVTLAIFACSCNPGDATTSPSKALMDLASDQAYRTAVAEFNEFGEMTEAEAYAEAKEADTHSAYTAFLVSHPDSSYTEEITASFSQFRLFETEAGEIISYDEKENFCWSDQGRIGYWRAGGLAGAMTGGPMTYFGPMTFWSPTGSVQLLSGSVVMGQEGLELSPGTKFIYQTKCREV